MGRILTFTHKTVSNEFCPCLKYAKRFGLVICTRIIRGSRIRSGSGIGVLASSVVVAVVVVSISSVVVVVALVVLPVR